MPSYTVRSETKALPLEGIKNSKLSDVWIVHPAKEWIKKTGYSSPQQQKRKQQAIGHVVIVCGKRINIGN